MQNLLRNFLNGNVCIKKEHKISLNVKWLWLLYEKNVKHGKASNIFLIKSYQKSPKIWFYFIFKLHSSKARVASHPWQIYRLKSCWAQVSIYIVLQISYLYCLNLILIIRLKLVIDIWISSVAEIYLLSPC